MIKVNQILRDKILQQPETFAGNLIIVTIAKMFKILLWSNLQMVHLVWFNLYQKYILSWSIDTTWATFPYLVFQVSHESNFSFCDSPHYNFLLEKRDIRNGGWGMGRERLGWRHSDKRVSKLYSLLLIFWF